MVVLWKSDFGEAPNLFLPVQCLLGTWFYYDYNYCSHEAAGFQGYHETGKRGIGIGQTKSAAKLIVLTGIFSHFS